MTHPHARLVVIVVSLCVVSLIQGADCSGTRLPDGSLDNAAGAKVILLNIENDSGVEANVDVSFFIGETEVRKTTRQLASSGAEATELVVPTRTDSIHIEAREAGAALTTAKAGDVLASDDIEVGDDVAAGDTLTYTIHPHGWKDCNSNDIDDPTDIANGTSQDCNTNSIPDECDIANGTSNDCNKNAVPDECETEQSITIVFAEQDKISATDQNGATPYTIIDLFATSLGTCGKIAPDSANSQLYFTGRGASTNDDTLLRVSLSGGTATPLINMLDDLDGVSLDVSGGKLYWSAYSGAPAGAYIGVANLDGTNASNVIGSLSGLLPQVFVAPSDAVLYFAQNLSAGSDLIQRVNINGTSLTSLLPSLTDPRDIDVFPAADLIVWADHGAGGGVYMSRLDGSNAAKIADVATVTGVAIDRTNCRVYWCGVGGGSNTGFIERADYDGGNRQTILSGLDAPVDVAVYHN